MEFVFILVIGVFGGWLFLTDPEDPAWERGNSREVYEDE